MRYGYVIVAQIITTTVRAVTNGLKRVLTLKRTKCVGVKTATQNMRKRLKQINIINN